MTGEEKWEKIKRTREQVENFCNYHCAVSKGDVVCAKCVRIYDFQIGLAEGRKEGFDEGYKKATERAYERQQDLTDTYIKDGEKIKHLGKENAKLLDKLNLQNQRLNELKKENAELKAQNKDLCESLDIMNNRESELLNQIEKMKCCVNCSKYRTCEKEMNLDKPTEKYCDYWELAE